MAKFKVKTPDGKFVSVDAPEGATAEQAIEFVADAWKPTAAAQPVEQKQTLGQRLGADIAAIPRQAGLAARYGIEGLSSVPDIVAAPVIAGVNRMLPESAQQMTFGQIGQNVANRLGLPQPQNPTERIVGEASKMLAGGGGMVGAARGLAKGATGAGKAVMEALAARPDLQAASAVGGGLAGGTAKEQGAGTAGQLGATLVGGIAGAGLLQGIKGSGLSKADFTKKSQEAKKIETLVAGKQAGYVVPPSMVTGSSKVARVAEGLGGKIKTEQAASMKNEQVTNTLARGDIGLTEDVPLTHEALDGVISNAFKQGYEPLKQAGVFNTDTDFIKTLDKLSQQYGGASKSFPGATKNDVKQALDGLKVTSFDAGDAVDMIKILRDGATGSFRSGNNGLAKAQRGAADALESQIERGLLDSGAEGSQMINDFRNARQLMAKTYTIKGALNDATGNVNAGKLARQLDKGKPLTGGLRTAAEFAKAFPKATQAEKNLAPYSLFDIAAGGIGSVTNPALTAAAASRPIVRSLALSKVGQRIGTNPQYKTNALLQNAGDIGASAIKNALIYNANQ
jgi:hypothetical protein